MSGTQLFMQTLHGHDALVVIIGGEVDATNADYLGVVLKRFALAGAPVVVDLTRVSFLAAAAFSVLSAADNAYRAAGVRWIMVPSIAVRRVLGLGDLGTTVVTATSVPDAVRHLIADAHPPYLLATGSDAQLGTSWSAGN